MPFTRNFEVKFWRVGNSSRLKNTWNTWSPCSAEKSGSEVTSEWCKVPVSGAILLLIYIDLKPSSFAPALWFYLPYFWCLFFLWISSFRMWVSDRLLQTSPYYSLIKCGRRWIQYGSESKAKEIEWMWKRGLVYRLVIVGMCVLEREDLLIMHWTSCIRYIIWYPGIHIW